jgi:hypothetical protein
VRKERTRNHRALFREPKPRLRATRRVGRWPFRRVGADCNKCLFVHAIARRASTKLDPFCWGFSLSGQAQQNQSSRKSSSVGFCSRSHRRCRLTWGLGSLAGASSRGGAGIGSKRPSQPPDRRPSFTKACRCTKTTQPGRVEMKDVFEDLRSAIARPSSNPPSIYGLGTTSHPKSAGGPFFCRSSIRCTNVIEGPSPGTAARPALKAARASSQHPARYAVSPSA